jgi:signal peptidase I
MKRAILLFCVFFSVYLFFVYFEIVVIDGCSMEPTIHHGQICIMFKKSNPAPGDIVEAIDNENTVVCKRLAQYIGDEMFLIGDNVDNSLDSRVLGTVPMSRYKGEIVAILPFIRPTMGEISFFENEIFHLNKAGCEATRLINLIFDILIFQLQKNRAMVRTQHIIQYLSRF